MLSFFLIKKLDKRITPIITKYIEQEVERITSNIVNTSVNEITTNYLIEDILIIKRNNENEIQLISYDTKKVNKLLTALNDSVSKKILELEEGNIDEFELSSDLKIGSLTKKKKGLVYEIPLGSLKKSTIFAHIGPKIPIRMNFIGQTDTTIKTQLKTYGINTVLVEIFVEVIIKERATMPISTKYKTIKIEAPLSIQIIQGNIPSYYYDKNNIIQ